MLGTEDHGIMTCYIYLDYGGSGQGFGGWAFDDPVDKGTTNFRRVGTAFGIDFIMQLLKAVGAKKWEDLLGMYVRVDASHSKVSRIGHIIKDTWFSPQALVDE